MLRKVATWARKALSSFRASLISISDPSISRLFGYGGAPNYSGVEVYEGSALGLSAVYRACALISGTIAGLPLRTLRDTGDGMRQRVGSWLDKPEGDYGRTSFEWTETILWHLLLHGDAFLMHVFGGAGQILQAVPIHPQCVTVRWACPGDNPQPVGGKWYCVRLLDGEVIELDARGMTQIMGPSLDGLRGMSVIAVARNSLGTAIAGDRAAAVAFSTGGMAAGIVTPDEDLDPDEVAAVREAIDSHASGWENNNRIAVLSRKLQFNQLSVSAEDAQFMQSRAFQIEEIARWFGVPPHLLMQVDKQSSWGTGVAEQNQGLARYTLSGWTSRIEQRLSRLLPNPRFVEFDYKGLLQPSPADEINLLIAQVGAGLLTKDEARGVLNLPPLGLPDPATQAQTEEVPANA